MELSIKGVAKLIYRELERLNEINRKFDSFCVEYRDYPEFVIKGYAKKHGAKYSCVKYSCVLNEKYFYSTQRECIEYIERISRDIYAGLTACNARSSRDNMDAMTYSYEHLALLSNQSTKKPEIKRVVFNNPATIVFWKDGTKTVVKCSDGDTYSKESGLAMCFMKKMHGNDNGYHKVFKEFIQ